MTDNNLNWTCAYFPLGKPVTTYPQPSDSKGEEQSGLSYFDLTELSVPIEDVNIIDVDKYEDERDHWK